MTLGLTATDACAGYPLLGTATAFYSTQEQDGVVIRNRTGHTRLGAFGQGQAPGPVAVHSQAELRIAPDGLVASLSHEESVTVTVGAETEPRFHATVDATVRRGSTAAFEVAGTLPDTRSFDHIDRNGANLDLEKRMDEQMIGDFTLTELEQGLAGYALTPAKMPDGWVTRAMLLVRTNPAYATRLVELFERPGMTTRGRSLIMDILASAGNPEAQAAMCDALSTDAAHQDEGAFTSLLQRLSFVQRPTGATVQFLEHQVDAASSSRHRTAAVYALGAAVGNTAMAGGDVAEANGKLLAGLHAAKDPEDRSVMIAALGNAGLPANLPKIAEYADDEDAAVRRTVAPAMRRTDTQDARKVLTSLVSDTDSRVAKTAIDTLKTQSLDEDAMKSLETAVSGEDFNHGALDSELVTLLASHTQQSESRDHMLDSLLSRTRDAQLASRI